MSYGPQTSDDYTCSKCGSHTYYLNKQTKKGKISKICAPCRREYVNAHNAACRARMRRQISLPITVYKNIDRRSDQIRAAVNRYAKTEKGKLAARRRDKKRQWKTNLRYYHITPEQYLSLLDKQGGVCAACKEPETQIRLGKLVLLSIDHDHDSWRVRGLLCYKCNAAYGFLRDSPKYVKLLLEYAESTMGN